MRLQNLKVEPASHSETGSGWTVPGQTDEQGRPVVFSKEAASAFAKMIEDSRGIVTGRHIASSQRSPKKNRDVRGAERSTHLFGRGMDIHQDSKDWIKRHGAKYGWNWAPYGGPGDHGGHFEFGRGGSTDPMDSGGGDMGRSGSKSSGGGKWGFGGRSGGNWGFGGRSGGNWGFGGSGDKKKQERTPQDSPGDLSSLSGKDKKIYLHWNAGSPSSAPTNYHTSILGSGEIRRVTPYDNDRVPHTEKRNSNAIGISVSGMAGASENNFGSYAIKPLQYQKMAEEVAQVAKSMGWTSGNINIKNVMTHAEAGSNKDGRRPHDNYGPKVWGGTGERWDLFKLYQQDADGSGGDKIRNMIIQKMQGGGPVDGNIKTIQTQAPYDRPPETAMLLQQIITTEYIQMPVENRTIAFVGGVNSRDNSKFYTG
jgi:hypothetical protein